MSNDNFPIARAAELSKLSIAMVDYLCRSKTLLPSGCGCRGRGRRREYSFGDVVMLRAMSKLLEHGISVARLKRGLSGLRKYHPEITRDSLPAALLCTDGKVVYFREGADVLRDLGSGQFAFAFIVELRSIQREVAKATRERPVRRKLAA